MSDVHVGGGKSAFRRKKKRAEGDPARFFPSGSRNARVGGGPAS